MPSVSTGVLWGLTARSSVACPLLCSLAVTLRYEPTFDLRHSVYTVNFAPFTDDCFVFATRTVTSYRVLLIGNDHVASTRCAMVDLSSCFPCANHRAGKRFVLWQCYTHPQKTVSSYLESCSLSTEQKKQ